LDQFASPSSADLALALEAFFFGLAFVVAFVVAFALGFASGFLA
jgi:hypothetical protein